MIGLTIAMGILTLTQTMRVADIERVYKVNPSSTRIFKENSPMAQRAPARMQESAPAEILASLNLGYNGYTDSTLTKPQMWVAASNVYSGAFGYIQRARFANVVSAPITSTPFTSLKYYATPTTSAYLLADQNGKLYSFDTNANYVSTQRLNPYVDPSGTGSASLNGPWSREVLQNIAYEMNGVVKQAGRGVNAATIEGFGLDTPDSTVQVTINAGVTQNITSISRSNGVVTAVLAGSIGAVVGQIINAVGVTDTTYNGTFALSTINNGTFTYTWIQLGQNNSSSGGAVNTSITKAVGRSYTWAWENANKFHIGAPAPVSQYIAYTAQNGLIQLIEPGSVTITSGNPVVTGANTFFTSAWIGRSLWAVPSAGSANFGRILSVQSATQLTLAVTPVGQSSAGGSFQIFDPQSTHIRLYATSDGGATYFRIARNAWVPTGNSALAAGLQFTDNANAEPPNFPFTTEQAQINNIPPPIGAYINEYQGTLCVFGVSGAPQSFFYSNQTATSVGQPQESFAPLNQVTLPIQNASLNGMLEFPGSLVLWSDHQDMFRLTGLLTDNVVNATTPTTQGATIQRLPYSLGIANPFACDITPLGGFWVTPNAEIWLFTDRYAPRNVGKPVQDILNTILPAQLKAVRVKYFHTNLRNWLAVSVAANSSTYNNTVLLLDLDLLASNGSPSYFVFDMATNHPAWWIYQPGPIVAGVTRPRADSLEVVYEQGGIVRLMSGSVDLIQDIDFQQGGFGTEIAVINAGFTTHAWGNDSAPVLKRPSWVRYNTNRDPSVLSSEQNISISNITRNLNLVTVTTGSAHNLAVGQYIFISNVFTTLQLNGVFQVNTVIDALNFTYIQNGPFVNSSTGVVSSGWNFAAQGIDDDFYTFANPLNLALIPGSNDSSSLGGNPALVTGSPFRHSPEMFRIGGVNFVMGRRLRFQVTFPPNPGAAYQLRSIQLGFGPVPPR